MTAELELSNSLRIGPLDAFHEQAQGHTFLWSASSERITTDKRTAAPMLQLIHELHRGRSQRVLIRVIPDGQLYRIEWPDIGPSDLTNLSRALMPPGD
jgi:hypothetical protein